MNCEEIQENAAAYVLGALQLDEHEDFKRHIATCDKVHDLETFDEVVTRLSYAVPSMEPSPELWARIAATIEAAEFGTDANAEDDVTVALPVDSYSGRSLTPSRQRRFDVRQLSAFTYAAAAAVLLVAGVLIGWSAATLATGDQPVSISSFHREDDGNWLRVEAELGRPETTLSVGNLDRLSAQNVYQFWAIRDGRWISIGEFNTNPEGGWSGSFDFALSEGDGVAITVEPGNGSEQPTSDAAIQSRI